MEMDPRTAKRGYAAMSERTSYTPGTPCWVELATPDVEAAESFYGELFGWEIPEQPNSAELGGYRRAKLNGRGVARAFSSANRARTESRDGANVR